MTVYDAIRARRTIRKYTSEPVSHDELLKLVDCARLAPYGANLQPLKFAVIDEKDEVERIHPLAKWAGYLTDWDPSHDELPPAYIAVLCDTALKPAEKAECDSGAAVMSMILAAQETGLSTCWLGAIKRPEIKKELGLSDNLEVLYLLAVGHGAQTGETFDMDGSVKYYFDEDGNVHVPKRTMDEVLVK